MHKCLLLFNGNFALGIVIGFLLLVSVLHILKLFEERFNLNKASPLLQRWLERIYFAFLCLSASISFGSFAAMIQLRSRVRALETDYTVKTEISLLSCEIGGFIAMLLLSVTLVYRRLYTLSAERDTDMGLSYDTNGESSTGSDTYVGSSRVNVHRDAKPRGIVNVSEVDPLQNVQKKHKSAFILGNGYWKRTGRLPDIVLNHPLPRS